MTKQNSLKNLRSDLRYSQAELGQILNVEEGDIHSFENQNIPVPPEVQSNVVEIRRLVNRLSQSIGLDQVGSWLRDTVTPCLENETPLQVIARGQISRVYRIIYGYDPTETRTENSHFLSNA